MKVKNYLNHPTLDLPLRGIKRATYFDEDDTCEKITHTFIIPLTK